MREILTRPGLAVEWYDRLYPGPMPGTPVSGDVAYYLAAAARARGPVLELGCGTGRVGLPLIRRGIDYTGLDASGPMLALARRKAAALGLRARWVRGDMARFALRRRFALIVVPFRAFQHLLTVDRQRACLARCRVHLARGGRLIVDLFDPNLKACAPSRRRARRVRGAERLRDRVTGRVLTLEFLERRNDPLRQILREHWRFTLRDARGRVLRRESQRLTLRWTYRHEMEHLLARCGFRDLRCVGDFRGGPVRYGEEQVWSAGR